MRSLIYLSRSHCTTTKLVAAFNFPMGSHHSAARLQFQGVNNFSFALEMRTVIPVYIAIIAMSINPI